jgi:hypothetical protein
MTSIETCSPRRQRPFGGRNATSQVSTACYLFSYPAFTVYFVEEVGHIILHEPPPFGTIGGVGNPREFRREAGQVFPPPLYSSFEECPTSLTEGG